ncbi:PREDICTED: tumor necrosis factor receptor superfamily member 6B-like [Branchiostoma belcheri]|uniref:Tumor necrosis factor receptor superfamily member 6B-like n=1 Tax=Branchiostoma belcheri TaxID=7741 RepID=A0A6P4ZSB0_BRABE|nr:PREDICTED: tumor necrosis factor receptor superfamily member 6B-like [Branchiostoma belcheri]
MNFGPVFRLCKRLILVIAVFSSHPVSGQVFKTPDWCTDDITDSVRLPSEVTCNLCPPGTYVIQDCTADNPDPRCESCTAGRFYNPCFNFASRCLSCSDCTPYFSADGRNGTVEGEDCTPTRDRVCRCSSNDFWDLKTSECRQKTSCDKGFGVAHIATHKADTACIPCEDGTFSDENSLTQQCRSCTDCRGGTLQPCTNTQDTHCDFPGLQSTTGSTSPVSAQSRSVPQVPVPVGSTNTEAVIGGSVGGCVLFLLFLGCFWWRCRRTKQLSTPASIRRRPSLSDSEDIEMNAGMLARAPEVPSLPDPPPLPPPRIQIHRLSLRRYLMMDAADP